MEAYTDDLRLAHMLADTADRITTDRFRALDLDVAAKPDSTPVTDADRRVEESIRSTLGRARPRDAVLGEEYGKTGDGARCWIVDPVDGTKNYLRGVPVWATLIALMERDEVVVGLVTAPQLGRRWWAARGAGAYTGRGLATATRCRVSRVDSLADAFFSYSSLQGWKDSGCLPAFLDLVADVWRTRAFGDFWSHVLVAEGTVDISAEPEVSLWDLAAVSVIVREAGGVLTDLAGTPGPRGGSVLCSNGHLHGRAVDRLGPA